MFNTSLNLTTFVREIPSMAIRRHIMLSLAGSINSAVVANADYVAQSMLADGYDLRELSPRDVDTILKGIEIDNRAANKMRMLMALRDEWEALLAQNNMNSTVIAGPSSILRPKKNDEPFGSLAAAIDSACGTQRAKLVVDEEKEKQLLTVGVTVTTEMRVKTAEEKRLKAQYYADQRAQRKGFIEWVLTHCFNAVETDDPFMQIDLEMREAYANKVAARLKLGITIATQNFLAEKSKDSDLGIADITILRAKAAELNEIMYAEPTKKVKKFKAKLQRVTAEGKVIAAENAARRATSGEAKDTVHKVKRTRATPTPVEKSLEIN